ncbi:MAG TPA: DUF1501 domain-containing protein, partial [Gemmataceae bacterium]|nr:DUF1501 domain-containing protein [Gemmataceae bacterium]
MPGGPSQIDTFDPKPEHDNGGPFKSIKTSVDGIRISEHLPRLSQLMGHMAIVRTMTSKEGDHGRATYLMRTGYPSSPSINYPQFGSVVAKEFARNDAALPPYVSIGAQRQLALEAFTAGFLGSSYTPLFLAEQSLYSARGESFERALHVQHLEVPSEIEPQRAGARLELLRASEEHFTESHPDSPAQSHRSAVARATQLMQTPAGRAFDLDDESDKLRDTYGRNLFGQGCLLARRLIERGVPFVEVALSHTRPGQLTWDTHGDNFRTVKNLSEMLDSGWATLMSDLKDRGLLESTTILWMGEFGRTPKINRDQGRDHWPNCYSAVLAGGGIKGGSIVGKTNKDGTSIEDRPVPIAD